MTPIFAGTIALAHIALVIAIIAAMAARAHHEGFFPTPDGNVALLPAAIKPPRRTRSIPLVAQAEKTLADGTILVVTLAARRNSYTQTKTIATTVADLLAQILHDTPHAEPNSHAVRMQAARTWAGTGQLPHYRAQVIPS